MTLGKVKQVAADKEAKLELRINVGSTAKNGDPVTFSIHKASDDSQLDTVDGTITKGKAVGDWKAKGPDPTGPDRSWRVYYKVTIGAEEAVSPELEVYLDSLELTSQDESGASLPDAGFTVFVGKDPKGKKATTGSSGTYKVTGLPPGHPVRVEWKAPIRQVGDWVEDGAGKKTAKLKKSFKAKLLFPEAGDHEQLTNHAPDKKKPGQGSKLRVRAVCVDEDGPTRKGDVFYVKVTWPDPATLSKRSDPARALVGGKKTSWSGDGVGKTVEITKDGAECVFDVQLGYAGGDSVTIEVGGTDTVDDGAKVEVKNGRKLYYQVTHRDTLGAPPDMSSMASALADVGVTYERESVEKFKADHKGLPKGSFLDGGQVGFPGETLVAIGNHNRKWFHKTLWKNAHKPIGVHVLLCDLQFDAGAKSSLQETHEVELTTASGDLPQLDHCPFKVALFDGGSGLVSGRWTSKAPKGHADHKKSGAIGLTNLDFKPIPKLITVTLPADASAIVGDGSGAKHPIVVRLTVKVAAGPYRGEADGPKQLIATREPDDGWTKAIDRTDEDMCKTMTHELGHTMNQVVSATGAPPGLVGADHGRYYTYFGPHCADGMSDTDYAALVPDTQPSWLDGPCVMFAPGGEKRTVNYCDRCKPYIKAERLTSL